VTVADADALLYLPGRDMAKLRVAAEVPALSPGWQQSFRDLLASDGQAVPAGASASAEPAWPGFRTLRVIKVVPETPAVSSIYLADPDGNPLPSVRAGQYLTIRVTGAGPPAPVRSYSLSSAPNTGTYRISVKREPDGAASTYLNNDLQPGASMEVAAPRGEFILDPGPSPVVLLSAGIGVTPVLSMLHHLVDQRSTRDIWWIHAARGPKEDALAGETKSLLASLPNPHVHLFYSAATPADCRRAHAVPGRLTKDKLRGLDVPNDASAYICGPQAFMTDIQQALLGEGIDGSQIHTELFGALPSINPGLTDASHRTPHQPPGPPGSGPMVTFARSGISTPFDTNQKSVLELADACDINTRWSCRSGVCHTCTTTLLSGQIAYRPEPLESPADGEVLICCARPETDIVLDM
jgi:ferredoxin-NADP reductase